MPLPFLTADRDGDNLATAAPLPTEDLYESRERRRRPYRPGPWRVGGAALLLLPAAAALLSAVIAVAAGSLPVAGICIAAAAVLIALAARLVRSGIWVSEAGLQQVRLLSATTVAWADVVDVRVVEQPVRRLGLRRVPGRALVVHRAAGEPLPALVTDQGADFLGRPRAFGTAVDAVADWVEEFKGPRP
ncbi:hypothetical protein FHS39_005060 [Streptomyces olivoverticillatus]|uniref:PH domain-containing protein n=1 Tax=Streptomyces olivoverticillatus TaxID=66427 RepID=A0A7W7LUD9_9ACTN|nr:hypothetical protein [Streptomyces olivoverticillatus]